MSYSLFNLIFKALRDHTLTFLSTLPLIHKRSSTPSAVLYIYPVLPSLPWYLSSLLPGILSKLTPPAAAAAAAAAAAKSLQSCPTLCDPIDESPPASPVPEILQARTLEWVAISFSNAWKWKVKVKSLSCVRLLATHVLQPTMLLQPMGFARQEYWSGMPLPSLRVLLLEVLNYTKHYTCGRGFA